MRISLGELRRHDHACTLYGVDGEFIDYASKTAQAAVLQHECALVIAASSIQERIAENLSCMGFDPGRLKADGQLVFTEYGPFYLDHGVFDPDRIIAKIEHSVQDLIRKGFAGLRGIGGIEDAVVEGLVDPAVLLDYEIRVQNLFLRYPISAVCAYRRNTLPQGLCDRLLEAHPFQVTRSLSFS